ncbi:MAG: serine hydrolase [Balneolales bacterium]|nr:serine hydrolase [Balneolales bacterium]
MFSLLQSIRALAATILVLLISVSANLQAQIPADLEAYLQERMKIDLIPSIVVASVAPDGRVEFLSLGYADNDEKIPATEETIYEIGSVTKTFTSTVLLLHLAEKGISMHDAVQPHIQDSGLTLPTYNGKEITFAHLASHLSGLPRLPDNMNPADGSDPYKDYTIEDLVAFANSYELSRKPGAQFEYSNFAYMLLGYITEHLTETSYDSIIEQQITKPLEMHSTFRVVPDEKQQKRAVPTSYGEVVSHWNFDEVRGLGELNSTAKDMAKYISAQLLKGDYRYPSVLLTAHEPLESLRAGQYIGFGWFVDEVDDSIIIGHGGGTMGFRSYIAFCHMQNRGAVVLTNSISDVRDVALHVVNSKSPLRKLPEIQDLPDELIAKVSGLFLNDDIGVFEIFKRGDLLFGQIDGQPALPLEWDGELAFKNRSVSAKLTFTEADNSGKSASFTLQQGGNSFRFMRIEERPAPPVQAELSIEQLEEYAGEYDSQIGLSYTMYVNDDALMARLSGQPSAQIFPEGNDRFFYKVVPASLEFERDENGLIKAVYLLQGGQRIQFIRK